MNVSATSHVDDSAPNGARAVLVTGASSGIGLQTCRSLAADGHHVYALARRADRLEALAAEFSTVVPCSVDLADEEAVDAAAQAIGHIDAIVHAAGGARGSAPVLASDTAHWRWMWQTNVLGTMYLLRRFASRLVEQGYGAIVVITSVAAFEALDGSSGYSTSKHAQSVVVQTLRNELLGTGVAVTEIAPGMVDTEFFTQRFPEDPGRAQQIFEGISPLTATDVTASIRFALDQPQHVNIDRIVLRPSAQGSHGRFHRP